MYFVLAAVRSNGTQNERSYGHYERFPCLMTRRLDFGGIDSRNGPTNIGALRFGATFWSRKGVGFRRL